MDDNQALGKSEELWDKYSEYIGDRIDELQIISGSSIIKRKDFINAVVEFNKLALPSEEEVNKLRDNFMENWKKNNPTYPESDYWSGVTDGLYLLLNYMKNGKP